MYSKGKNKKNNKDKSKDQGYGNKSNYDKDKSAKNIQETRNCYYCGKKEIFKRIILLGKIKRKKMIKPRTM